MCPSGAKAEDRRPARKEPNGGVRGGPQFAGLVPGHSTSPPLSAPAFRLVGRVGLTRKSPRSSSERGPTGLQPDLQRAKVGGGPLVPDKC